MTAVFVFIVRGEMISSKKSILNRRCIEGYFYPVDQVCLGISGSVFFCGLSQELCSGFPFDGGVWMRVKISYESVLSISPKRKMIESLNNQRKQDYNLSQYPQHNSLCMYV